MSSCNHHMPQRTGDHVIDNAYSGVRRHVRDVHNARGVEAMKSALRRLKPFGRNLAESLSRE